MFFISKDSFRGGGKKKSRVHFTKYIGKGKNYVPF